MPIDLVMNCAEYNPNIIVNIKGEDIVWLKGDHWQYYVVL